MKLFLNALTKFLIALVFVFVLLFVPAGGFGYVNGWIFVLVLFVPVMIMGGVLLFKAPGLLEKRLNLREKEKTQKGVVAFSALFFLAGFILAGLAIPLILGSWWALCCFLLYIPVLVVRILNEEKVLSAELEGYSEYKARVKFRLFPFVW